MNEPIGGATRMGVFPFDRWKAGVVRVQNELGNVTRSTAERMDVEGMKKLHEPPLLQIGQAQRGRKKFDGLAAKAACEAQGHIQPEFDQRKVERHQKRWTTRNSIAP